MLIALIQISDLGWARLLLSRATTFFLSFAQPTEQYRNFLSQSYMSLPQSIITNNSAVRLVLELHSRIGLGTLSHTANLNFVHAGHGAASQRQLLMCAIHVQHLKV